jgi:hypothetical protein
MSPFNFTLNPNVPAGVVTALATIATAVNTAATVPGKDMQLASQKLGEFEAYINYLYRV